MAIINRFSNLKFWGLGAIALLISALPIPAMAQSEDNSDSVPYRLLIPLLQPLPLPGEAAQLQVGAELPTLPIDLPTPQSGVLQWSLINRPQYFTLLFEVPQGRSQVEATYLEQLQTSGWRPWSIEQLHPELNSQPDELDHHSDVVQPGIGERTGALEVERSINVGRIYEYPLGPHKPQVEPLVFCKQGSDATIELTLFQTNPDRTKLQIGLVVGQPFSICAPRESSFPESFPEFVWPPPTAAQIDWIGGGGSSDYSESRVTIQTPQSLDALADHYAAWMRQQGWDLQISSGNDLLQWSVWSHTDNPDSSQQATIHLFATENSHQYIGAFRAQSAPGQAVSFAFPAFSVQVGELPKATALQILRDKGQFLDNEPYELWLEQLPPLLSAEVTIPSETAILGGASTADTDTAILETSLPPGAIRTFYRQSLTAAGWQASSIWAPADSFAFETSGFFSFLPNVFCQPEKGTELMLQTLPGPNDLTTVRLRLYASGEFSPCRVVNQAAFGSLNHDFWANIPVPNLQAPPETTVLLAGGDSGGNYINSPVYLRSRLTAEALAHHYAEQMGQAGWTQRTATQSDGSSVSLWRIETEAGSVWQGLLGFIAQSEPGYWAGYFTAISEAQIDHWIPAQ